MRARKCCLRLLREAAARSIASLCLAISLMIAAPGAVSPALAERVVTDMGGRAVEVPDVVARVATIGPVPVLNSFVFALGEAASLVNALPPNLGGPRWRLQYVIAPRLKSLPVLQSGQGPSVEGVLEAAPDVVLTMDLSTVDLLARTKIPTLYLSWQQPDDVKAAMRLLGGLYGRTDDAESYCRYFDETLARVGARVDGLSDRQRPRVLYASLKRMTQPHRIAEWWIAKAGGKSVTDNGRTGEAFNFSIEQVLAWNPEVMIVSTADEVADAYADPRLAAVSAIRSHRVHAIPMGVHLWGNRTVEQPLTILWTAKVLHPELFGDLSVADEVRDFYARFFRTTLGNADLDAILEGRIGQR